MQSMQLKRPKSKKRLVSALALGLAVPPLYAAGSEQTQAAMPMGTFTFEGTHQKGDIHGTHGAPARFLPSALATAVKQDGPIALAARFIMPAEAVALTAKYLGKNDSVPGLSLDATNTKRYNEFLLSGFAKDNPLNPFRVDTAFSAVVPFSGMEPGKPQIDDNLSAPGVIDWVRLYDYGASSTMLG
jgi:hypothetical protein